MEDLGRGSGSGSGSNNIVQYLDNKTILITGGSGFLAKILLEKMLRIQPNIARIYVLIRASDSKSLAHRFENEVLRKELFRVLKRKCGANFDSFVSERVVPVAGDVSCDDGLGIKDPIAIKHMRNELDIIVNFAATTNFQERYDAAMDTNTWGALHVMSFAKKCPKLKRLIHVSTAYVCGEKEGIIQEIPFMMGETLLKDENSNLDIYVEKQLIEDKLCELRSKNTADESITSTMKQLGINRAKAHGWPNTYVFTKAMGEMILEKFKNDVPIIILRPTMITSTFEQPFPGWIEGLRTIDAVLGGHGKGKIKCLPYDPNTNFDAIPADMVINSILAAMIVLVNHSGTIYHIGSSSRNPITFSKLQDYSFKYFTENPLTDNRGFPIKVEKIVAFDTMTKFRWHVTTRYLLPLEGLRLINIATFQYYKDFYVSYTRKIKWVMELADLYKPYMYFKGIFDDTNTENMRMEARKMSLGVEDDDDDAFNFDPKTIDWEDYFLNTHFPGLVNHVILKKLNY